MGRRERRDRRRRDRTRRMIWLAVGGAIALAILWAARAALLVPAGGNASAKPVARLSTADYHSLAFSASEPETAFFGHHGGLMVTRDGGRNWRPTSLQNADAMALAAPAIAPDVLYAAGHGVFFKSTNGGRSWGPVANNLPGLDIHGFAADPERADLVYAYVVRFGVFQSANGGSTWHLQSQDVAFHGLAIGANSDALYGTAGESGLWRSPDAGVTWSQAAGQPGNGALAVTYDRVTARLYLSTLGPDAGLYISDDGGETWEALDLKGTFLAVAVSPIDPAHLLVVDDRGYVYASRDGGATWSDERT